MADMHFDPQAVFDIAEREGIELYEWQREVIRQAARGNAYAYPRRSGRTITGVLIRKAIDG